MWLVLLELGITELLLGVLGGIWVETKQHLSVLEGVLLLGVYALGDTGALDWAENSLDFRAVDELGEVRLGNES